MQATRFRSADAVFLVRASTAAPEIRGERRLCFYAATFNTETVITGEGPAFREVIRPGAFAATLAQRAEVYACVDHVRTSAFSDQSSGLILQEDARGLFATCYLADTPAGNQVLADVKAGKLPGCSFGFRTVKQTRSTPAGQLPLVELLAVNLVDVCLTARPAYPGTVVSVRSAPHKLRDRRLQLLKLRAAR